MTTPAAEKLAKVLRQVQDLLALADHPGTDSNESQRARERAERLMMRYRIEEAQLSDAERAAGRPQIVPVKHTFRLCMVGSEFALTYFQMAMAIAEHVGARIKTDTEVDREGQYWYNAILVGFDSDVRYAEILYTSARTYFAGRMEPKWDPNLSDGANVYVLRSAGMERGRIGQLAGWGDRAHQKVTRTYIKACKELGERPVMTGKGNSMKTFREAFALRFPATLQERLYSSRDAAARDFSAGQIVLANRKQVVDEAFYTMFPQYRPVPPDPDAKPKKIKPYKPSKADLARMERLYTSKAGVMGQRAGRSAAEEVDIHAPGTNRLH